MIQVNPQECHDKVLNLNQHLQRIDVDQNYINESQQEINKFINNYQPLMQYCAKIGKNMGSNQDDTYYKGKFQRDHTFLIFFKEIVQQVKSINLKFEELIIITNVYHQIQMNKASIQQSFHDQIITLFSQAKDLYTKEKKTEAFEKFTEVLQLDPGFIDARIYRGYLNLDVNNISYAQFDFEEVLKQDKQNLKALKGITKALKMQCNYELGLKYAMKVIKHEPNSPIGNFNAADCLKFLGQYNENTLQFINKAIDQEKRKSKQKLCIYYRNKGEILFGLNKVTEARKFVQKALKINQNYELALKTLKRFDETQLKIASV